MNIYETHNCSGTCMTHHVAHDVVCHANCNHEEHVEKGYSNTIVNFFTKVDFNELTDEVKAYLSLVSDLFDNSLSF